METLIQETQAEQFLPIEWKAKFLANESLGLPDILSISTAKRKYEVPYTFKKDCIRPFTFYAIYESEQAFNKSKEFESNTIEEGIKKVKSFLEWCEKKDIK